jgi:hypothetical protein
MKTKKFFLSAFIAMILSSCASPSYFQVYKTVPSDKLVLKDNLIYYEDENCKVSYNMWRNGGNIGFQFYNKTDKYIYLNLEECFFILNGISHNYYKNRVFTSSTSSGTTSSHVSSATKSLTDINYLDLIQTNKISTTNSLGVVKSSGFSVSYYEEKIVCIPSNTSKYISEYIINESLFRDCDLFKYPTKKQIKSKSFSKEQSPLVFSNRIAYTIGESDNIIKFENEFYVSEITNYPENAMFEAKFDEYCEQKSITMSQHIKYVAVDKFYIKYNKGKDIWNH